MCFTIGFDESVKERLKRFTKIIDQEGIDKLQTMINIDKGDTLTHEVLKYDRKAPKPAESVWTLQKQKLELLKPPTDAIYRILLYF